LDRIDTPTLFNNLLAHLALQFRGRALRVQFSDCEGPFDNVAREFGSISTMRVTRRPGAAVLSDADDSTVRCCFRGANGAAKFAGSRFV
jgi:hypothetical protein